MDMKIDDVTCWVCGWAFNEERYIKTFHHVLPKHLQPKHNVEVPICKRCHGKINERDAVGLFAFAVKLERMTENIHGMMRAFLSNTTKFMRFGKRK